MTSKQKNLFLIPSAFFIVLSFQACGPSFQTADVGLGSLSSTSAIAQPPADGTPGLPGVTSPTTPVAPSTPPIDPADPADAGRRVLQVCGSGCAYSMPSQAIAASQDGDIVDVAPGDYNDCMTITHNGIKIRGVGGRPHLTGVMCGQKGEIVNYGNDIVIENFEFSGAAVADRNGAGIRHQGLGLIVRNSYFHDNEDGILSGRTDPSPLPNDVVLVENCKFEHNGGDAGHSHAVYFGAHAQINVRNSQFLAGRDQGHEFKSRAKNSTIDCSFMGSLDGVDSYSLNFPDAGNVNVTNSVVEQGTNSSNSGIIDYGSEMLNHHPVNTITFNQVAVINDAGGGTFFQIKNSTQVDLSNITTVGPGSMYNNQTGTETALKHFADRASAGFAAYPAFPKPAACTGTIGLSN